MREPIGIPLPRYYAQVHPDGWRVADHHVKLGEPLVAQGVAIHAEATDEGTARALAKGLNEGSITPDELAE